MKTVLCWKLWAGYIWNDYYMEIEIETWKIPPYQVSEMVTWYGGFFITKGRLFAILHL